MNKFLWIAAGLLSAANCTGAANTTAAALPPLPELPRMTIFGTSEYTIKGTTLITTVDEEICEQIIRKLSRMPFLLNGRYRAKNCKSVNEIVILNFFLPDLTSKFPE